MKLNVTRLSRGTLNPETHVQQEMAMWGERKSPGRRHPTDDEFLCCLP